MRDGAGCARPRFRGRIEPGGVLTGPDGHSFAASDIDPGEIARLAGGMDGTRSLAELAGLLDPAERGACAAIVAAFDAHDLVDDAAVPETVSGLECLLELEQLTERLCAGSIYRNPFWQAMLGAKAPGDVPLAVVHGMVIENWQFLVRESYFDAPVLSFVPNRAVRLAMNAFFAEEYGHDEILARALATIGIGADDLADSIPLPETLGLCNALAYWSLNDPLFFFTTLGLLEGQGLKEDSFIDACERMAVDPEFVAPLRLHSNINIGAGHGNLTRLIFARIDAIDGATARRLTAQTHLFVELYDAFYAGVWRHYSTAPALLRRVSEL